MTVMHAVTINEYGGSDVLSLEQLPRPSLADDEVLVRVCAIGINPIDWKLREGFAKERIPLSMPAILGTDISGVVHEVGNNVQNFVVNDDVIAMVGITGAYAEFVAVKESLLARKPNKLSHAEAASLPLASLTAWQGLFDHGHLESKQHVLIHAAAGSVGAIAVQLAKRIGAIIWATASSNNEQYVSDLGADHVINYREQAFEDEAANIDLVLDLVGGDYTERSLGVIRSGGQLVQLVPSTQPVAELAKSKNIDTVYMTAQPNGSQLQKISDLVKDGQLTTLIARSYGFSQIAEAHDLIQSSDRPRGKIVIEL